MSEMACYQQVEAGHWERRTKAPLSTCLLRSMTKIADAALLDLKPLLEDPRNQGRYPSPILVEFSPKMSSQEPFFNPNTDVCSHCKQQDCHQEGAPATDGESGSNEHSKHAGIDRVPH